MINLTKEYLKDQGLFKKIKHMFKLDLYYASSLHDIYSYFKDNPPKKRDFFFVKNHQSSLPSVAIDWWHEAGGS